MVTGWQGTRLSTEIMRAQFPSIAPWGCLLADRIAGSHPADGSSILPGPAKFLRVSSNGQDGRLSISRWEFDSPRPYHAPVAKLD